MFGKHHFWKNAVSKTRETYNSWRDMRYRCYKPDNDAYKHYGERGIIVCDRWKDNYDNFVADIGLRPVGMTLERKDVNGNYTPENCIWTSTHVQARNRRNNAIHVEGIIETDLAKSAKINLRTFRSRLKMWGDLEEALTRPVAHKLKQSPHGSRKRYERYGCRCDLCKSANSDYARRQRLKRKAN